MYDMNVLCVRYDGGVFGRCDDGVLALYCVQHDDVYFLAVCR